MANGATARPETASGWAVVGLGAHAVDRMLPALRRARRSRLVGVYSRRVDVTRRAAEAYGAKVYASFERLLEDRNVDVVYLATPNDLHRDQTVAAAEAGKHVLVEKPMALSVEDAAAMTEACRRAGVRLSVGHHLRFHPAHQRARALVASGAIGELVWATARWVSRRPPDTGWRLDFARSGGTSLTARGVHVIDLVRFVAGREFETVGGVSDGFGGRQEWDDVTAVYGALEGGGFGHALCSRLVPGAGNDLEVLGTGGTIVCRGTISTEPSGTLTVTGASPETAAYNLIDVFAEECHWFSGQAAGDPPDGVGADADDGMRVTAVTEALIASIRTARVQRPHYSS